MPKIESVPEVVRKARAMAHRAVTEGVDLGYVERLRQELYALADAYEKLDQQRQREDAPPTHRYRLVVESDKYDLLTSLCVVAEASFREDDSVAWTVRSDEELRG